MDDAVESYLTELARTEHEDPVLVEMEARAAEHGFPIVGRATGRFLELAARAIGARRVMELGSGYGYSAYWFAGRWGRTARWFAPTAIRRTPSWPRTTSARQAYGIGCDTGLGMRFMGSRRKPATSTWCTATSTRTVTRTAGARRATASGSVGLWLCDNTLWSGHVATGNRQRGPDRRYRLHPRSTTSWWPRTPDTWAASCRSETA